jgi:hypothetical protein
VVSRGTFLWAFDCNLSNFIILRQNEIKDYCRQQGLNFDTAEKLSQSWNKNTVALSYRDPSKGSNGLLDDTPCPLVLLIRREKNGKLVFEQTEHTKKYIV